MPSGSNKFSLESTDHFLFTLLPKQSNKQGGARAVDLPARSFDMARALVERRHRKIVVKSGCILL